MPSAKKQASLHPGSTGSSWVLTPPAQKELQCSLVQPWSKPEQPTAMDGLFQDEHYPPRLSDFPWVCFMTEGTPYLVDASYLNPAYGNPDVWETMDLSVAVVFINLYLDSHGELKGCLCNALNSLTTKLSEKKPCVFLSYKISQLLPNFPSRTILICFLSLQPTFLENFNMKKPRVFCCFYVIFIAVTILVQFYISFGGMQSVHRISCASITRRQIRLAASPFWQVYSG